MLKFEIFEFLVYLWNVKVKTDDPENVGEIFRRKKIHNIDVKNILKIIWL